MQQKVQTSHVSLAPYQVGVQQKTAICVQHLRQTSDAKNQPESARRKRARTGLRQRQLQNLTARWRWHCFNGFF